MWLNQNMHTPYRSCFCLLLPRDIPAAGAAAKITMREKSLFLPREAFPANISALVRRSHERIVMLHFPIALFTSNRSPVDCFRIDCFSHLAVPLADLSLDNQFRWECSILPECVGDAESTCRSRRIEDRQSDQHTCPKLSDYLLTARLRTEWRTAVMVMHSQTRLTYNG